MHSDLNVKSTVEGAFSPLQCVAEIWDYNQKLRFKVFDAKGDVVFEMAEIILREIRKKNNLASILSSARKIVEKKGFMLDL